MSKTSCHCRLSMTVPMFSVKDQITEFFLAKFYKPELVPKNYKSIIENVNECADVQCEKQITGFFVLAKFAMMIFFTKLMLSCLC